MKRSGIALMLVAVMGLTVAASADTTIWFESGGNGAPGTALVLTPGLHTVTMMSDSDLLSGYSQDLYENAGASNVITGWTPLVGWMIVDEPGLGGSPVIFDGGGEAALFGAPISGVNALMTFELNYDGSDIFAGVGFNVYSPAQMITFGPNAPIGSSNQNMAPLAVIVPEPATLALLGFGAIALIRRRR